MDWDGESSEKVPTLNINAVWKGLTEELVLKLKLKERELATRFKTE